MKSQGTEWTRGESHRAQRMREKPILSFQFGEQQINPNSEIIFIRAFPPADFSLPLNLLLLFYGNWKISFIILLL